MINQDRFRSKLAFICRGHRYAAMDWDEIASVETSTALLQYLESDDENLCILTIVVLSKLPYRTSVRHLVHVLQNTASLNVQIAVVEALGQLGGRKAVLTLIECLQSRSVEIRERAASSLRWLSHPSIVQALIDVIENKNEAAFVREMAIEAVRYHDVEQAVPSLLASLEDSSPEVRYWAADALGYSRSQDAISALLNLASTDADSWAKAGNIADVASMAITSITQRLKEKEAKRTV